MVTTLLAPIITLCDGVSALVKGELFPLISTSNSPQ